MNVALLPILCKPFWTKLMMNRMGTHYLGIFHNIFCSFGGGNRMEPHGETPLRHFP